MRTITCSRTGGARLILVIAYCLLMTNVANSEDTAPTPPDPQQEADNGSPTSSTTKPPPADAFDASDHKDWGHYYDPKNQFCGSYDCYKILGFDYGEYDSVKPDRTTITKRYRSLSRFWHPDKSKHPEAKDRFVKIARAYEVLTNEETRKEYDFMRFNQEAYFQKYGSDVMYAFAPKSDAIVVTLLLLGIGSALSWMLQKQQWQRVANKLIRASVEDWSIREGGTKESKDLRERALVILAEREAAREKDSSSDGGGGGGGDNTQNGTTPSKRQQKKKNKLTTSERKKQQQEALRPIVAELVEKEFDNFGAGYHKPTWRDLLVVRLVKMPVSLAQGIWWNTRYFVNRARGVPLTREEREVLTRRAVGEVHWVSATKEEQGNMIMLDLWVPANMADWEEEKAVKLMSAGDQKRYRRMKKKGKGKEFFEQDYEIFKDD